MFSFSRLSLSWSKSVELPGAVSTMCSIIVFNRPGCSAGSASSKGGHRFAKLITIPLFYRVREELYDIRLGSLLECSNPKQVRQVHVMKSDYNLLNKMAGFAGWCTVGDHVSFVIFALPFGDRHQTRTCEVEMINPKTDANTQDSKLTYMGPKTT